MNARINNRKEIADLEIRLHFIPSEKKTVSLRTCHWNKKNVYIEWKRYSYTMIVLFLRFFSRKKKKSWQVCILVLHLPSIPSVWFSVESARMPEEDSSSNTTSPSVPAGHEQSTDVFPSLGQRPPPYWRNPKSKDLQREQLRKSQSFKIEEPLAVAPSNHENIAFESKHEREYVSTMPGSVG